MNDGNEIGFSLCKVLPANAAKSDFVKKNYIL